MTLWEHYGRNNCYLLPGFASLFCWCLWLNNEPIDFFLIPTLAFKLGGNQFICQIKKIQASKGVWKNNGESSSTVEDPLKFFSFQRVLLNEGPLGQSSHVFQECIHQSKAQANCLDFCRFGGWMVWRLPRLLVLLGEVKPIIWDEGF